MSVQALVDVSTYIGSHDFTTDTNNASLAVEAMVKDATTFGSGGWTEVIAGLKSGTFDLAGFWQSGTGQVDPDTFTNLGTADMACTVTLNEVETEPAYLFQLGKFSYSIGGPVGEIAPFTLSAKSTNGVGIARGQLASAKRTVSATGQLGSIVNLGAPTSTQYVYATLHVFTSGTTITVQLQSDDSAAFTTPTTRGTFGPITTAGGTFLTRIAGPFAGETHWRLNVSAITGSHVVAGAIAVQ